jgi:hypothetical protein
MSGPLGSQQWMYASGGFYDHTIDNSLRFEDGDSAYLNRTPASAGNRKTWTWSGWVKRGNVTTTHNTLFMGKSGAVSNAVGIVDNQLRFYSYNGSDFDFQKNLMRFCVTHQLGIILLLCSTHQTQLLQTEQRYI